MPSIASLIEYADPIDTATPSDAVVELFLNAPTSDLLAVVDGGRPVGIVGKNTAHALGAACLLYTSPSPRD